MKVCFYCSSRSYINKDMKYTCKITGEIIALNSECKDFKKRERGIDNSEMLIALETTKWQS